VSRRLKPFLERVLEPTDPVKYDFALARLGILGACPSRQDPDHCAACPLSPACQA
jgi:adenine-specific DNA glycosylase